MPQVRCLQTRPGAPLLYLPPLYREGTSLVEYPPSLRLVVMHATVLLQGPLYFAPPLNAQGCYVRLFTVDSSFFCSQVAFLVTGKFILLIIKPS